MKAFLECVPCVINQITKILNKRIKSVKKREEILKDILFQLSMIPITSITPPEINHEAYNILRKHLGNIDFFLEEKQESNKEAKKLVPKKTKDLGHALLYSIAGNIIDYGPTHCFDIKKTIKSVLKKKLSPKHLKNLKAKLKKAKTLLYICDNAGEIVFDKLLIDYVVSTFDLNVTVAVKSKPVLNDALLADAEFSEIENVIESGSVLAGTNLNAVSREFKRKYQESDIIIAKGQGNFETLPHDKKIFFLLMVKCFHLAKATGLKYGEVVLWSKG